MQSDHARSADDARRRIDDGTHDRVAFRAALLAVPATDRDAWLDRVLGLGPPPEDGPELPHGCVPYLPCDVDVVLEVIERAAIGPADVVVDVGSGVGRAMALVHLLTEATTIGIEIQEPLVRVAREVTKSLPQISTIHGDAVQLTGRMMVGTVFFLYCPFGGTRLDHVLAELEPIARLRPIQICCVDLPLPARPWLEAEPASGRVGIYRSVSI